MVVWVVAAGLFVAAKWGWILGVPVILAGYGGSCWWWPLARCLCCSGKGKHWRSDGKVFKRCRWCKGSGARRRVGRVAWDAMTG